MISIDIRKLIEFGKGSFIVSMPKSWVVRNNLKKGDLISVNEDGFELVLAAKSEEKKIELTETTIDAKGKSMDSLKVEIVSSYLNGYDTINILFDSSSEAPKIKNVLRNLSGLEIMEQTSTKIVAKNLINVNEIQISNIIRRTDTIIRSMMEDTALCATDRCTYDSINHRDADVNRLYFLGYKVLKNAIKNPRIAKSLGLDAWQLHGETQILLRLEKIADSQKRIARNLCSIKLERWMINEFSSLHIDMSEAYKSVMKAYYSKDRDIAIQIEAANKSRTNSCDLLMEKYIKSHSGAKGKSAYSDITSVTKAIENLKAASIEIRNIARTILCYG